MVEFRMFGALSLTTDGGRDARSLVTQPRRLALLAYLAAARPRGTHALPCGSPSTCYERSWGPQHW